MTVLHASTTRHGEWGGPARYIRIVLHPDVQHLRRAATRYRREDFSRAAGCFHPARHRQRCVNGEWVSVAGSHWAGVMRLSRDALTTEIIVHECVHAAAAIYRMDVNTVMQLGDACNPQEETLAYIVGDLTKSVVNALHGAGAWQ